MSVFVAGGGASVVVQAAAADAPWWLPAGVAESDVVGAWNAKGAASEAASLVNLANPGTHDLSDHADWDAVTGWNLSAGGYLTTDIIPTSSYTVIIRTGNWVDTYTAGVYGTSDQNYAFYVYLGVETYQIGGFGGRLAAGGANGAMTTYATAGQKAYKGGLYVGDTSGADAIANVLHFGQLPGYTTSKHYQIAAAVFSRQLTADEIVELHDNMMAIGETPEPDAPLSLSVFDTFTATDGTDLDGVAPDAVNIPAASWDVVSGAFSVQGNQVAPGGGTDYICRATYVLGAADGRIILSYKTGSSGAKDYGQILFRYQDSNNFMFCSFGIFDGVNLWNIGKVIGGVITSLASGTFSYSVSTWYVVEVDFLGSSLSARWNGAHVLLVSGVTDLSDKTTVGIAFYANGAPRIDDFQAYTA